MEKLGIVTLSERVNFEVAKKLSLITFSQFEYLFKKALNKADDICEEVDITSDYTKLKNFCRAITESKNDNKVSYGYTQCKDFGRLQSKTSSLQRVFNPFRGLLCEGLVYDLDMDNAHPCMLLNLCNKHKIKCDKVEEYINNREKWLEQLMNDFSLTRRESKEQLLKCLNKATLTTKIGKKQIKNKNYIDFDKQLKEIMDKLYEIYGKEGKEHYKHIKDKEEWNKKGCLMSLLLQKIENDYLTKAREYLDNEKIEICTLMYDGCMTYIGEYKIEAVILGLNKLFKKEGIKWSLKQHNLELKQELDKLEVYEIDSFTSGNIINISEHIIKGLLKDRIFKCENEIFLVAEDKVLKGDKIVNSELYNIISKQDYVLETIKQTKNGEESHYEEASKTPRHIRDLVEAVMKKAPTNHKLIKEIWDNSMFKLYYNDGYYDFKLQKFVGRDRSSLTSYSGGYKGKNPNLRGISDRRDSKYPSI